MLSAPHCGWLTLWHRAGRRDARFPLVGSICWVQDSQDLVPMAMGCAAGRFPQRSWQPQGCAGHFLHPVRLRCPRLHWPACGWGGACCCRKWGCIQPREGLKWHSWSGRGLRIPACCSVLLLRLRRWYSMLGAVVPAGIGVPNPLTKTLHALGHEPGSGGASCLSGTFPPAWPWCVPLACHPRRRGDPSPVQGYGSSTGNLRDPCARPGMCRVWTAAIQPLSDGRYSSGAGEDSSAHLGSKLGTSPSSM